MPNGFFGRKSSKRKSKKFLKSSVSVPFYHIVRYCIILNIRQLVPDFVVSFAGDYRMISRLSHINLIPEGLLLVPLKLKKRHLSESRLAKTIFVDDLFISLSTC